MFFYIYLKSMVRNGKPGLFFTLLSDVCNYAIATHLGHSGPIHLVEFYKEGCIAVREFHLFFKIKFN
jgi:hypothetical protein